MFHKKIGLLLLCTCILHAIGMSQQKNYNELWKKVESLREKGQTGTAYNQVLALNRLAQKENRDDEQIRCAIYLMHFREQREEDSEEKNIAYADTLIASAKAPAKQILLSMQAEMYWDYFQQNRWKLYGRKQSEAEDAKDISTWSIARIHRVIGERYRASLNPEALLQKTPVERYTAILIEGKNTRNLRPSLYDLLAHRALEYFATDEHDLLKPADAFSLEDAAVFADAAEFARRQFQTNDSTNLHYVALQLYQRLIAFHLSDPNPDALMDADLLRLQFAYRYAVMPGKDSLYEQALRSLSQNFSGNPASAQADWMRAALLFERGSEYHPINAPANGATWREAAAICQQAIKAHPQSGGAINCANLLQQIQTPELTLISEKVNLPAQPFRSLLRYRNAPKVFLRVVPVTHEELKSCSRAPFEKRWALYAAMKPLRAWSVMPPDPNDFHVHSAEIKIDALPVGTYLILAGLDEAFTATGNIMARQLVYVSAISYVKAGEGRYYALHRESGKPLGGITVQLWETAYDYRTKNYEETSREKITTAADGSFRIATGDNRRNYAFQLKTAGDELFMNDEWLSDFNPGPEMPVAQTSAFLFTDRSIYRPGQLLYFKGIVLRREPKASESRVLPAFSTRIVLRDANDRPIAELPVKTNDYGSYHGSFRIPEGLLNGSFTLTDSAGNGRIDLQVEEYKRPRFFVELRPPAGTFRVNDNVVVPGLATAYAGNKLSGAQVRYRVVRKMRFPVWWDYGGMARRGRGIPGGRGQETEIASGTTRTGENGSFNIEFMAIPDRLVDKKDQPVFYYSISADVTDVNGETRSAESTVAAGYQLLQLEIQTPERLAADSFRHVLLRATNLNGTEEPVAAAIRIQALRSPGKIFRERYWEQPDQFTMTPEDFTRDFPLDVYRNEHEVSQYPVSADVKQLNGMTGKADAFPLQETRLSSGWYKLTATAKDKLGETVTAVRYLYLTDANAQNSERPLALNFLQKGTLPGEKITYSIGSAFDRIWLLSSLRRMQGAPQYEVRELLATTRENHDLLIGEADRGGMEMSFAFVRNNRVYIVQENMAIPWSDKELDIRVETFRDKMLPGAEETIAVRVSGRRGGQVAAEMLAAMYDASLDQFRPHSWQRPDIWPMLQPRLGWIRYGFNDVASELISTRSDAVTEAPEKTYDRLLDLYAGRSGMVEYGGVYRKSKPALANRPAEAPVMADMAVAGSTELPPSAVADSSRTPKPATDRGTGSPSGIRSDFSETVFFYPQLNAAADGSIRFSFKMPDAVTRWKLLLLAHTPSVAAGVLEKTTVTAKPLMVQANPPRFLRSGDDMYISAKLVNLSSEKLSGTASMQLLDAASREPIRFLKGYTGVPADFTLEAGKQTAVDFRVRIPDDFTGPVLCRISATSSVYTDGEEALLPVLPKTIRLTASMPITPAPGGNSRSFRFEELLRSGEMPGGAPVSQSLIVEYAANPTWLVVQALPYLMESGNESVEELFNRYYANTLAASIVRRQPAIGRVFEKWRTTDTAALLSNLQKNSELKNVLLEETPWVMEAQGESEQKKQIAKLFDRESLTSSSRSVRGKLRDMQSPNGGFVWFKGAPEDRYMTQYVLTGIGQLRKAGALTAEDETELKPVVEKALAYLDRAIAEDYRKRNAKSNTKGTPCQPDALQYLYMRSHFTGHPMPAATQKAAAYYRAEAKKGRYRQPVYLQGMIALVLQRAGDTRTAQEMIRSLKQNAILKPDYGMYWRSLSSASAYYWHQAPIEGQALLIEAFTEIEGGADAVDDLRYWLLRQKQTRRWPSTRATAAACYALLLKGSEWTGEAQPATITLGGRTISPDDAEMEAGTGYFKKSIPGSEVIPAMGEVSIALRNEKVGELLPARGGWGAVYWQYFQAIENIRESGEPLKVGKQLFIERNSSAGPRLEAMTAGKPLAIGDKVIVRLTLKTDRDLEYVHMKDLRAACMEPVNVLSDYKYQGGLGYYETTRDASVQFFFPRMPRGTYVFDYPMFVSQAGVFNGGICTLECLYAPEFTSHSSGQPVQVNPNR